MKKKQFIKSMVVGLIGMTCLQSYPVFAEEQPVPVGGALTEIIEDGVPIEGGKQGLKSTNALPAGSVAELPSITQTRLGLSPYNYTSHSSKKDGNWAQPDKITTSIDSAGNLVVSIVDTTSKNVHLHTYQIGTNNLLKSISLDYSTMPIFGNFHVGADGFYYLVVGQNNLEENDDQTVVEVRKYDAESGALKGTAAIKGGITYSLKGVTKPFDAGQPRVVLHGSELIVHMSREMYKSENDGLNHQANLVFSVDTKTMAVSEKTWSGAYQSHSFNQFIAANNGSIVTLGHGDAYSRGIELTTLSDRKEYVLQAFDGNIGANYTGATISGFEVTDSNYLVTGRLTPQTTQPVNGKSSGEKRNAFIVSVDKATMKSTFSWVTTYAEDEGTYVGDSRLIKLSNNQFAYLYSEFDNEAGANPRTVYHLLDGTGAVTATKTFDQVCFTANSQPTVANNQLFWVSPDSTLGKTTYLYQLDVTNPAEPKLPEEEEEAILPTAIEITSAKTELKVKEVLPLTAVITPENSTDKTVTWTTNDEAVATVSANGEVTGKKAGTVSITATTANGKSQSLSLTITETKETVTGTFGTVPWTWEADTQTLTFGAGEFPSTDYYTNIKSKIEASEALQGKKIKQIAFTETVAANKKSDYLFASLSELEGIKELSWLDTSNLTSAYRMFDSLSKLTELDVSSWDTSNVTDMSYMFNNVSSLTEIAVSNWNTSKVIYMGGLFSGMKNLVSLDVSKWDTGNVTNMNSTFSNASKLAQLDVSQWNTSKVKYMSGTFQGLEKITQLDVSKWNTSNVTTISYMFQKTNNLIALDLNSWDTSSVTNMAAMFHSASGLTTLNIDKWDTSNVTTMSYMFYSASGLTTLNINNWDTGNVNNMSYIFYSAKSLTTLDINNWDTSKVTTMSYMFYSASGLTTLDIDKWNTSNVTTMSQMFRLANSLTALDLTNWDTSNVNNLSYMFHSTSSLTTLDLSKWDTRSVTDMTYMFNSAKSLKKLDIHGWDTSKATTMSWMFSGTTALDTLILGANTHLKNTSLPEKKNTEFTGKWVLTDGNNRYASSQELMAAYDGSKPGEYTREKFPTDIKLTSDKTELEIDESLQLTATITPETNTDKSVIWTSSDASIAAVSDSGMVTGKKEGTVSITATTTNGKSHSITLTVQRKSHGLFGTVPWIWEADTQNLVFGAGEFPNTKDSLNIQTEIESSSILQGKKIKTITFIKPVTANQNSSYLFFSLSELEAIKELSLLDTSNVTSMYRMFKQASSLKDLDISQWNTSRVTNMSAMFTSARNLAELDVSQWDTSKVTNMAYMFSSTSSLTKLDLSQWNTSKVTTMASMFAAANNLIELNVSGWNTGNVANMSFMFSSTSKLPKLDVSKWDTGKVANMSSMFASANSLTELDVSQWNTSNVTTMASMFYAASSLPKLDVSNWNTSNVAAMSSLFSAMGSLTSLNLSNWDMGKATTMAYMFNNAHSLDTLILGANTRLTDARLPEKKNTEFTGGWVLADGSNQYTSSQNLVAAYDGSKPGEYVREKIADPTKVTGITMTPTEIDLAVGKSRLLYPVITPETATNKKVTYTSSAPAVAKVFSNGKVQALSPGTATITATTEDGSFTASSVVTVK